MSASSEGSCLAEVFLSSLWSLPCSHGQGYGPVPSHKLGSYCFQELLVGKCRLNLSRQSYNLCYNPFFTATLNCQIKDAVCIPRPNRIGEKQFPHKYNFYLLACHSNCRVVNRVLINPYNNWTANWLTNFRKLIPPVVAVVLSHSASASGNKWFH